MDGRPNRNGLNADVSRLRSLLIADARRSGVAPGAPRLLMLAGLPGSGKSTFARELSAHYSFVVLESDRLRKTLVARPQYTADEHSRVFRACHLLIDEFLGKGYPVLLDATNLGQRNRRPVIALARRHDVPLGVVVVTAPPEVVRQRLVDRESGSDPDTWSDAGVAIYDRMAPAWQPVMRQHFEVDTSRDIAPALQMVLDWARS